MPETAFHKASGTNWLQQRPVQLLLLGATGLLGLAMGFLGMKVAAALALLPLAVLFAGLVISRPQVGLWYALVFSFLASGLTRYIALPWGLMVDVVLITAMVGWGVRQLLTPNHSAVTINTSWRT